MNTTVTLDVRAGLRRHEELMTWIMRNRQILALPVMFVLAIVTFSLSTPKFLTIDNLTNVARQSVYLLIVSLGQLIVLVGGGLDLSVGSIVALTSVVSSLAMAAVFVAYPDAQWLSLVAGIGTAMLVGSLSGLANGLGVTALRIPPFMMTLGMSSLIFGVTLFISGGVPVYGLPPALGKVFGFGRLAGLPIPTLVAIALVAATYVAMEWTRFGRYLYATGGNPRATALSGIAIDRISVAAFVLCGLFAALSGFLLVARLGTGETSIGQSLPLESMAACVISGVTLSGGRGRTLAVVLGTLLIVLVQNGLNLMQVGAYAQTMATGAILIFAMAIARH